MPKKLLQFFPKDYEPSTGQVDIIKKIDQSFGQNNKFVIVSAATGTGKSFIPTTLANSSNEPTDKFKELINSYQAFKQDFTGNFVNQIECEKEPPFGSFTLTITKSLQDQYKSLFSESVLLKGKSNYVCAVDNVSMVDTAPCMVAPRLKEDCCKTNKCPYYSSRNVALTSKHTVLNYKMFLHLPGHVKRRNYIICDEASELENEMVKMFSLFLDIKKICRLGISIKMPRSLNNADTLHWLTDLSLNIGDTIESLIKKHNKESNMVLGDKIKISALKNYFMQINSCISEWSSCEWVIDAPDKDLITVTPLKVNALMHHIFDYADKVVLMSATIIDHKKFAASLGITQYDYVEAPGNFNPKQSPIYISKENSINYANKDKVLPKIAQQINELCNLYKDEKGIIHTQSFEITNIVKKYLKGTRFLFRDDMRSNDDILDKHYNSPDPTVLVSPSLTHGVDLKDDLARFCIIVKLPFLPLSNKRIKKLFELDKDWYQNQMLNILVQMCGRATRSKTDHSNTYILDGNAYRILPMVKDKLPSHFIDRVV